MSEFINTIDQLGDEVVAKSIIDKSITELKDNVVTTIGDYAFNKCTNLEILDLPSVTSINKCAFSNCAALTKLILRSNTLCTLKDTNAFWYTPIARYTSIYNDTSHPNGHIYVPRALLSDDDATMDYRRATNWTSLSSKFRALEDYTVDGTTTGELDSTKI